MMSAIIGWTGFVGQYLTRFFPDCDLYNSSNIESLRNKIYDTIYFSAMPAEKWKINQNPSDDKKCLVYFMDLLKTVKCKEFVLISTIDVLDCTIVQNEYGTHFSSHAYGMHRKQLEDFIKTTFSNNIIVRLPGLFGKGLKKNVIYDLLHNNQIEHICLDSSFQYYNLENLFGDIKYCRDNKISLIHLVANPICTRTIVELFFPTNLDKCIGKHKVSYTLDTIYPLRTCVLDELGNFINWHIHSTSLSTRVAVSNLAWNITQNNVVEKILRRYKISNCEMAFTTLADWSDWNDTFIDEIIRSYSCKFISCQSILYNTNIEIFKNISEFILHYKKILELCKRFGISRIVFGSPKNRHVYTTTEDDRIKLFQELGNLSVPYNIFLCIEPNSRKYGCTWMTNLTDVYTFVEKVNHPNVCINFDFGNYCMENDTTVISTSLVHKIKHVQISTPFLKPLNVEIIPVYNSLWKLLVSNGYIGTVSLEMISSSLSDILVSCDIFNKIITNSI